ncbi:MAG: hypothetical protein IPI67_16985 [Myxococcales bacterium]|nr:hypothetical protein [Myxococcales bacterium]
MPRTRFSTPLLASLCLVACGSRSGLLEPSADAGLAGTGGSSAGGGSAGVGGGAAGSGGSGATPACAFGTDPFPLALGLPQAYAIAVDDAFVYVTTAVDGGALLRVPKTGGEVTTLVPGLGRPRRLSLDATRAWVTSPMDGRVLAVEKDGSALETLMPISPGHPEGIVATTDGAFWVRQGPGAKAGALFAWQPATGSIQLAGGLDDPGALAIEGTDAYWIDNTSGGTPGIWHYAPSATAAPQLVTPLPAANGNDLALDETHVYYAMNAEVGRVARTGGPREPLSPGVFASGVALGGPYLYFVEGGATTSGRLARLPRAGGPVETLATELVIPRDVALDDACVYWTNQGLSNGSGSVMVRAR